MVALIRAGESANTSPGQEVPRLEKFGINMLIFLFALPIFLYTYMFVYIFAPYSCGFMVLFCLFAYMLSQLDGTTYLPFLGTGWKNRTEHQRGDCELIVFFLILAVVTGLARLIFGLPDSFLPPP